MLTEIYDLDTSKSTLVYIGASFGFIFGTPIAGITLKNNLLSRRKLAYVGYNVLALGMIIRTGDFGNYPKLWMSCAGQVIGGVGMAILLCIALPELVDSIEK
jgi:hypothetical protein